MKEKGQTTIEYLLLLAVSISLGVVFLQRMSNYFLNSPNSFIGKSLNSYKTILGEPGSRYKTFKVVK